MKKIIPYDSIEKKNALESDLARRLSPEESLIHCLNVMDFMAAFRDKSIMNEHDDAVDWIILEKKKK